MDLFFQSLLTAVLVYKYVAIFLITFFGALALPLPTNTIITASSFFSLQGYLDLRLVFLAGFLGNILGDLAGFFLARKYGKVLFSRLGLKHSLSLPSIVDAETKLRRHSFSTVLVSRFVSIASPMVNIFAGIAHVPIHLFSLAEILGAFGEVGIACAVGVVFGDNWQYIETLLQNATDVFILTLALLALILWRKKKHAQKQSKKPSI